MSRCKVCKNQELDRFLDLGAIPPVNSFLEVSEIPQEKKFPLTLGLCPGCHLVQLEEIVPPDLLFRNYHHLSQASASNLAHIKSVADLIKSRFRVNEQTRVFEIGSNDGSLLEHFKSATQQVLGVDPAENLIPLSRSKGVEVLPLFFSSKVGEELRVSRGEFDIIVGLNVIPHVPEVVDVLKGLKSLLAPRGTLLMEGVYALETILRGEFDTVYHEHVYCFSLHSLINTFRQVGLKVIDVELIPTQGGSLRVFATREENPEPVSERVTAVLERERRLGLTDMSAYSQVTAKAERFKGSLLKIIHNKREQFGPLIGLGAPARGVVILNYCGIGMGDVKFLVDDTPLKHGKHTPGVHIPVMPMSAINKNNDKCFLLLSWNYKDQLLGRLKEIVPRAEVVVPFPELVVETIG